MDDNEKEAVLSFLDFAKWSLLALLVGIGIIGPSSLGIVV
jgi:hypothetical protein